MQSGITGNDRGVSASLSVGLTFSDMTEDLADHRLVALGRNQSRGAKSESVGAAVKGSPSHADEVNARKSH